MGPAQLLDAGLQATARLHVDEAKEAFRCRGSSGPPPIPCPRFFMSHGAEMKGCCDIELEFCNFI